MLVVDEFNLEIVSDGELLGRWFLGDVEVNRLVADRFALYLGDEEAEFAAEDALQFAYDGVAAMQQAWLKFKKNQRRHRKAAAVAAGESDRRRGKASKPPGAIGEIIKQHDAPPEPKPAPARRSLAKTPRTKRAAITPPPAKADPTPPAVPQHPVVEAVSKLAPPPVEKPAAAPAAKTRSRIASLPTVAEKEIKLRLPSEGVGNGAESGPTEPAAPQPNLSVPAPSKPAPVAAAAEPDPAPVRLAPEGHHPQETNKPLRSLFRREPKLPEDHVHRYEESTTVVGLRRRVCVECAYVSIAADGE